MKTPRCNSSGDGGVGGYDQNYNEHGSITSPTVVVFFSPNVQYIHTGFTRPDREQHEQLFYSFQHL